jgi:hypothetical protein
VILCLLSQFCYDGLAISFKARSIPMLDEATIESRLVSLEQTVSDLQLKVENKTIQEDWLQKLTGSISDEAAFLEAMEYGSAFRQSDRPVDEDE